MLACIALGLVFHRQRVCACVCPCVCACVRAFNRRARSCTSSVVPAGSFAARSPWCDSTAPSADYFALSSSRGGWPAGCVLLISSFGACSLRADACGRHRERLPLLLVRSATVAIPHGPFPTPNPPPSTPNATHVKTTPSIGALIRCLHQGHGDAGGCGGPKLGPTALWIPRRALGPALPVPPRHFAVGRRRLPCLPCVPCVLRWPKTCGWHHPATAAAATAAACVAARSPPALRSHATTTRAPPYVHLTACAGCRSRWC